MAIKEIKREWSPCQLDYVKTFLLHSEKDVKDLPKCCVGSKATVSETDNEYYCTADGWKLGSELGGGGSSDVVILPETVLTVDDGKALIAGPLQAPVSAGDTVSITYNGTEYECTGVDGGAADFRNVAFGNLAAMGATGGNPDAPFVVILAPDGGDFDVDGVIDNGCYGGVMPLDGSTTITLSIVQGGAASGGESAGGYLYITGTAEDSEADSVNVTMSMPFEVVLSAVHSGKPVFCALHNFKGNTMVYVLQVVGYSDWAMIFGSSSGQTVIEMMWTETNGCVARLIT